MIHDDASPRSTAKAVILYDRLETVLAAKQFVARLAWSAGGGADWTVNSWQFDMLERGDEARKALDATSDAGLMMVAMGGSQALHHWPEDWLARWAALQRVRGATLVLTLIGTASRIEAESSVIAPLRRLTERSHLELFIVEDNDCRPKLEFSRWNDSAPGPSGRQPALRHPAQHAALAQFSEPLQQPPKMRSAAALFCGGCG
jgi:hypothetical protein